MCVSAATAWSRDAGRGGGVPDAVRELFKQLATDGVGSVLRDDFARCRMDGRRERGFETEDPKRIVQIG